MELEEEATGLVSSKIKIPNPAAGEDEEEKQQQDQEDEEEEEQEQEGGGTVGAAAGTRVCELCGKIFRSGKALGGHMRMHSQYSQPADRNRSSNRSTTAATSASHFTAKSTTTTTTTTNESDYTTPPACCLCGKNFLSMKALFGHMRAHPDREWRGIQPPPPLSLPPATTAAATTKTTTSSSTLSDDDQIANSASAATAAVDCHHHRDVDLSKSLYGCSWPVSTKRGRSGAVTKTNEAEAVSDLLMLSRRGSTTIDKEDQEFNFRNRNRRDDVDDDDVDKGKANYKLRHGGEDYCYSDSQKSESINAMGNMKNNNMNIMMMIKKKRRKMKLADLEEERGAMVADNANNNNNNNRSYTCSICNKSFPTHQALGGHRSSHNNSVNNITKVVINPNSHSHHVDYYDHNHNQSTHHEDNPQDHHHHQCKICKKMFPTGQALGGHKRSHWNNNNNIDNAPMEVLADQSTSLSPGEASQTTNRVKPVISFDLNELPPMEEEDDNDKDNDNDDYLEQLVSTTTLTLQVS